MTSTPGPMAVSLPAPLTALPTPALLVDRGRLDANITDMADLMRAAGARLRPHVKTSKCLEVARRQLDRGAVGLTCSTPEEVRWLHDAGVDDLLWAHQPIGPAKVAFTIAELRRGGLMVALDSVDAAAPLAEAATAAGVVVPFLLEVDTGLGRAGVDPPRAPQTAAALARLPSLDLRGVLTHEGQLTAHHDDRAALEEAGRHAGERIADVAAELRAAGHDCPIVSVGSTPGATSTPFAPGVTEARPGTYVYGDAGQVALGSATPEQCAQTVLARVVSAQRAGTVIIDAGSKAMSSDRPPHVPGLGTVCDAGGTPIDRVTFSGANEEHGYLTGPGADTLEVGDLVRIVPNHACTTTNMWSGLYVIDEEAAGHRAVDRWAIHARH